MMDYKQEKGHRLRIVGLALLTVLLFFLFRVDLWQHGGVHLVELTPEELREAYLKYFKHKAHVDDDCRDPVVLKESSCEKVYCKGRLPVGRQKCIVYSFGINYQWQFDDELYDAGCSVYSFDPGMDYPSKRNDSHYFEAIGLGAYNGIHKGESTLYSRQNRYKVETIQHIMARLHHDHIDMLRMDVEGAEMDVLESLPYSKIDQLSIEIHMWKGEFSAWLRMLDSIPMKHIQSNRNVDKVNKLTGTEIVRNVTRVYEMTFVKY